MSKVKVYTEEQVRKLLNEILMLSSSVDDAIESLTPIELPSDMLCVNCDESKTTHNICMECIIKVGKQNIELPSDEEIDSESPYLPKGSTIENWYYKNGFIEGMKHLRDKIQKGKNEQQ